MDMGYYELKVFNFLPFELGLPQNHTLSALFSRCGDS